MKTNVVIFGILAVFFAIFAVIYPTWNYFGDARIEWVGSIGIALTMIMFVLLGGFLFGHRSRTRWALSRYLLVVFVGFAMVFIAPDSAIWVSIAWFIAGLGIAPALGLLGAIIGASVKTADAPEAYGWVGSGQMIGYAGAAAIAGSGAFCPVTVTVGN